MLYALGHVGLPLNSFSSSFSWALATEDAGVLGLHDWSQDFGIHIDIVGGGSHSRALGLFDLSERGTYKEEVQHK